MRKLLLHFKIRIPEKKKIKKKKKKKKKNESKLIYCTDLRGS